jgi:hypothetical protein
MDCFTAQRYMRKQLTYWRIQEWRHAQYVLEQWLKIHVDVVVG